MAEPIIFHHIRNATSKLSYSGLKILVDPFFTPKEYYPGFSFCPIKELKKKRVPLVDLPIPIEEIIKDIDACIVSHLHFDHWDEYTAKYIPKNIPIFVQNSEDKKMIQKQGFSDVRIVEINAPFKGITITKTGGQHSSDGPSMGFVFRAPGQKTVYFGGDTIWYEDVVLAINKYKPDLIVLNAPEGRYEGFNGTTMMDREDVKKCYELAKNAKIIPVHMNSFPHCICTISKMKKYVKENKLQDRVLVPTDGEILKIEFN